MGWNAGPGRREGGRRSQAPALTCPGLRSGAPLARGSMMMKRPPAASQTSNLQSKPEACEPLARGLHQERSMTPEGSQRRRHRSKRV